MSNIIENFKKSNPDSIKFRRFIPNPFLLNSIDKMIEDGKVTEAETTIMRFMTRHNIATEIQKGTTKPVEAPVEEVTEPTPDVTEPTPEVTEPTPDVTEPTPEVTESETVEEPVEAPVEEVTEPTEEVVEVVEETTPKKGRKKKTE